MNERPPGELISIATLNIAAASMERAHRLLDEWIEPNSHDVYVFTETSEGDGTKWLLSQFASAGWLVFQNPTAPKDRGVAIASRLKATELTTIALNNPVPGRIIAITLNTNPGLQVVGMYVPNRGNDPAKTERKRQFLDSSLRTISDRSVEQALILLGDLNVVPPTQHPRFLPQERFEYEWYKALLSKPHLYDAAIVHNGAGHEMTWVANTGEGYTYDHILLHNSLPSRVTSFTYDHTTRRTGGVTDHSALVLAIRLDAAGVVHRRPLIRPKQSRLF